MTATVRAATRALDVVATISPRAVKRLKGGHPWIFRSDVVSRPSVNAGIVRVESARGEPLGWALWSPASEISLRHIEGMTGTVPAKHRLSIVLRSTRVTCPT